MGKELSEQVAYLRGLVAGRDLAGENTKILWERVVQIFDLTAGELGLLRKEQEQLQEYIEAIDEDLGYLEDHYYPVENPEEEAEVQISSERARGATAGEIEESPH